MSGKTASQSSAFIFCFVIFKGSKPLFESSNKQQMNLAEPLVLPWRHNTKQEQQLIYLY